MKKKDIVNYLLLFFLFSLLLIFLYQSIRGKEVSIHTKKIDRENIYNELKNNKKTNVSYAQLMIPDLNINRPLYNITDKRNNVEKEVMVLETSDFSSGNIVLAAHSGEGYNAYFNILDQLDETMDIYILYQDYIYTYKLFCFNEVAKTGYVIVNTYAYPTLQLITCKKNDSTKQIVFTAKMTNKEKIIPN